MRDIVVNGGRRLNGKVTVQGAKNSVLPVLAATFLCSGPCVIHNCPNLSDVQSSLRILAHLGCVCAQEGNTVSVDSSSAAGYEIPEKLMREMRSSVVFLGAIVGKVGRAVISSPGGCELGPRPIDLHLEALSRLGVVIEEDHGFLQCTAPEGLKGNVINLSFPSVGATENIILAATFAKGKTVIHNAAKEPEISDLADFLNSAGARIYGCGSDTVEIYGVERLHGAEHSIISDRIVAATYMVAAAVTHGDILLESVMPSHFIAVTSVLKDMGCKIFPESKGLRVIAPKRLHRVPTVRTLVYPAFPTDAGPVLMPGLAVADGTSCFIENIFQNRYRYVDELKRLGAKIKVEDRVAVIEGVARLSGACCECTDLRGGAALVVAGLSAEGSTRVSKTEHIHRGYENIVENFAQLNADIQYSKIKE